MKTINCAIIFDMDGVIIDSELHWKELSEEYIRKIIPGWNKEDQKKIIGLSLVDIYKIYVEEYGLKMSFEEIVHFYQEISEEIYAVRSNLISGAKEKIIELSCLNYNLALASSSPKSWIDITMDRFDLRKYFQHTISSQDVAGKGKPLPDIYLHTAKLLNINPENCLAIEDTQRGVESAKNAKMKCVGFRNGFNQNQDLSFADIELSSFSEFVPDIVTKLLSKASL